MLVSRRQRRRSYPPPTLGMLSAASACRVGALATSGQAVHARDALGMSLTARLHLHGFLFCVVVGCGSTLGRGVPCRRAGGLGSKAGSCFPEGLATVAMPPGRYGAPPCLPLPWQSASTTPRSRVGLIRVEFYLVQDCQFEMAWG